MIGIIQGRLSRAPIKRLQHFPKKWKNEFNKAKKIGYDYIEFFSERRFNPKNPIWKKNQSQEYTRLAKKNNLKIYSFVDDYIISNSVELKKTRKYLQNLIRKLSLIKIKKLVLPLYGKSKLTDKNLNKLIIHLKYICDFSYKFKIQILLEGNFSPKTYKYLKNFIRKNLYVVIDTGNRINLNYDLYDDILKFNKNIKHIHIKDKNDKNENVVLGSGNVDFKKLKKTLKKINYKGSFTIESTRGKNPDITAIKNLKYIKKKLFN